MVNSPVGEEVSTFFYATENALQVSCPLLFVGIHPDGKKEFANLRHASSLVVRYSLRAPLKLTGYTKCQGRVLLHDPETSRVEEDPTSARQWQERKLRRPQVRDRLCQLIRQHQLDAHLVKSYAVDLCGSAEGLGQIFCFGINASAP
jgi:hypothetical protein